jgi:iron complex outermembrane receptor protein
VFRANGSIAAGSFDQIDIKGSLSGPVTSGISAGVAVLHAEHDGYVEDRLDDREYNDKNTTAGRAALAINPSSNIRIDLTADYSRDDAKLNVGRPVNNLTTFSGGTLVVTDPVGSGKYNWKGETTPGFPNSTKLKTYGFAGTAAFDVTDAITLKSITAYRNLKTDDFVDIDATHYEVGDVFVGVRQNQFSQEFQATYTGTRLNAVAGLYYLKENIRSHQEAYADDLFGPAYFNTGFLRTIDDKLRTQSYAAFGNASYEIVPTVRLSAGLRYTKETKDYWRMTSTFYSVLPVFNATYVFDPPKGKWSDWSPMASLDWQVTPNTMLYARAAKGFKSGGFNGRANSVAESTEYDPETVWSYEAGFKTTLASQLRLNGAIFDNEYKDFQARVSGLDTDPVTGLPSPKLSVLNAGKMRIRGAELEAAWTPTPALLIDAQLGYLDAKYKRFEDARFTAFGGSRAFQTPAFAPKWTLRLGSQYAFDLGSVGWITVGAQTRYRSRQALAVDNTLVNSKTKIEGLFQDGYWVEDARIVWENASKKLAFGLYGYNLTNKAYKTDAQEFSSVGNIRTVYYGSPRTITLRLTARY